MRKIVAEKPETKFLIPYVAHLKQPIEDALKPYKEISYTLVPAAQRYDAYHQSGKAIAVSGTVGLELALMGVPHVICYRFGWLTYQIARCLVKTPYAHLANIVLKKPFIPELLQDDCTAARIATEIITPESPDFKSNIKSLRSIFSTKLNSSLI
jgi:lipid-A-disaccharide synthase